MAVANFFPQLSLTGLFGQVSPETSAFTSGAANAWSIGASLTGPLFQGGRLRGQYRQALAVREQAALSYQQTVLGALQEISNDVIAVQRYGEQRARQNRAVRVYEVAFQASLQRYIAGHASYYEVLQQQQQLFPAEGSPVQSELNQFLSFIEGVRLRIFYDGGYFSPIMWVESGGSDVSALNLLTKSATVIAM